MIRVHKGLIFALPILLATPAIAQMSVQPTKMSWETGNGRACTDACSSKGLAVQSGTYSKTSTPYFVCRMNAHQEGARPGYQVQTNPSTCTVGWGDKEEASNTYDCLCIAQVGWVNKEETSHTYDCPYIRGLRPRKLSALKAGGAPLQKSPGHGKGYRVGSGQRAVDELGLPYSCVCLRETSNDTCA